MKRFDGEAEFWDCREDAESLSCSDPLEAIEEYLSEYLDRKSSRDAEAQLRELGTLEVWPWSRHCVTDQHVESATDHLLDRAAEFLDDDEELGDPDGDAECLPAPVLAKYRAEMHALVKRLYAEAEVWGCEQGLAVEISTEELLELVREELPALLEKA